jgi:uracil-DNA glycosylase family 4
MTAQRTFARLPALSAPRRLPAAARAKHPDWHNAPVPNFGPTSARLLIVGLAPGLQGANRTGRPFTGDWAGDLLYETLLDFGFATGVYDERPDDGLTLTDARIVNAVRCVPPENKPTGPEIATCRQFLVPSIAEMPDLRAIVALGRIAHESLLRTLANPWRAIRSAMARGMIWAGHAVRQLSLLALQHQYRPADAGDVPCGLCRCAPVS